MDTATPTYWLGFLKQANLPATTPCYEVFGFRSGKQQNEHLLELVLSGQKTATSSAVFEYKATDTPFPIPGVLSIVLDGEGCPSCVIETHTIHRLTFAEVDFNLCSREGENESLESWQIEHLKFFKRSAKEYGLSFTEASEIIFEEFRVIYR